jgi:hypothetical protein
MNRSALRALAAGFVLWACAPPLAAPATARAVESTPSELGESEEEPPSPPEPVVLPQVLPGAYRLRLASPCRGTERSVSGSLTLQRISPNDVPLPGDAASGLSLLWGQADLDVASLDTCLAPSGVSRGDPIHPEVLIEVLRWDGLPQHQVLLVSTEPRHSKGQRAALARGVALWVEQVQAGHLSGVWCRWELSRRGEGRWEADLVRPD